MTAARSSPEFDFTGVWLDHFLGSDMPPMELFRGFALRGGKGVILNGNTPGAAPTVQAVENVHQLGLQAIVTVYISDLRNATASKAGLEQIGLMVSSADAVVLT